MKLVQLGLRSRRFQARVNETWFIVERTGAYVGGLFAGTESTDQLSGPIRIAQVSGQVATAGIVALLNLAGDSLGLDRPD